MAFTKRKIKGKKELLKLGFEKEAKGERGKPIIIDASGSWFTSNELNKFVFVEPHTIEMYDHEDEDMKNPAFTASYVAQYPWIDKKGNCYQENWLKAA